MGGGGAKRDYTMHSPRDREVLRPCVAGGSSHELQQRVDVFLAILLVVEQILNRTLVRRPELLNLRRNKKNNPYKRRPAKDRKPQNRLSCYVLFCDPRKSMHLESLKLLWAKSPRDIKCYPCITI